MNRGKQLYALKVFDRTIKETWNYQEVVKTIARVRELGLNTWVDLHPEFALLSKLQIIVYIKLFVRK